MSVKDILYSWQWEKNEGETENDYQQRLYNMIIEFEADEATNGSIVIFRMGGPEDPNFIIRLRNYIRNPIKYRREILNKLEENIRSNFGIEDGEYNLSIKRLMDAGFVLPEAKKRIKTNIMVASEIDKLYGAKCGLCQDQRVIFIFSPISGKDGFVDKGGIVARCPVCADKALRKEEIQEKTSRTLV